MADTTIFDVDGTLVDSNYQHALAFFRAFRRYGITVPVWRIHRAVGMGGHQLIAHVDGQEVEDEHGEELREAWVESSTSSSGRSSLSTAPATCSGRALPRRAHPVASPLRSSRRPAPATCSTP